MNAIKSIPQVESLSADEEDDKENRDSINMRAGATTKIYVMDQKLTTNPLKSLMSSYREDSFSV